MYYFFIITFKNINIKYTLKITKIRYFSWNLAKWEIHYTNNNLDFIYNYYPTP